MATHAADPNIIVPAIIAAIPVTIAAVAGMIVTLHSVKKRNQETQENTDRAAASLTEALTGIHDEVRTNHGKRAGEYIEQLGPLVEWAAVHQEQDNEIRIALGLPPGEVPQWRER